MGKRAYGGAKPRHGAASRAGLGTGLLALLLGFTSGMRFQNALLQHIRSLEGHDATWGNRNFLPRLRVAANALVLFPDLKRREESLTTSPRVIALHISSIIVSTSSADSVRDSPTLRNTDSARSARVTVFPAIFPHKPCLNSSLGDAEIISLVAAGQGTVPDSFAAFGNRCKGLEQLIRF